MRTPKLHGFTFIEVIVVIGIVAMFASLVSVIAFRAMNRRQANSEVEMLLSAVASQQQNAANRALSDQPNQDYGIYFSVNSYTMFAGSNYSANNPANRVTNLPTNVTFSNINVPGQQIVFAEASGFIKNFNPSQSAIIMTDQFGLHTTITINRLGIVEVTK